MDAAGGLVDGPLSASQLSQLGLKAIDQTVDALYLHSAHEDLTRWREHATEKDRVPVGFRRILTASRTMNSEANISDAATGMLGEGSFCYQSFDHAPGWDPFLLASTPDNEDDKVIVGVRRAGLIVIGIPILAMLGAKHSTFELPSAYLREEVGEPSWAVEALLRDVILEAMTHSEASTVTVNRWPAGYDASFTLRHDYDRAIPYFYFEQLIDFYDELGIKSSTGFLRRLIPEKQARMLEQRGHEAALHSETLTYQGFQEEVLHHQESIGSKLAGVTFHGGAGASGMRGAQNVNWAKDVGLEYIETYLKTDAMHPVGLHETKTDVCSIPMHITFDASFYSPGFNVERTLQCVRTRFAKGLHATLMNHPDLYVSYLRAALKQLDLTKVWCATHRDIVRWTNDLHDLKFDPSYDRENQVTARRPLSQTLSVCFHDRDGDENFQISEGSMTLQAKK